MTTTAAVEAKPVITCPTATHARDGTPHTIIGCGSTNVERDESEPNIWDCGDCGIWFDPSLEVAASSGVTS